MSESNCGRCGLPIHQGESGLRYSGTSISHAEYRCHQLHAAELAAARARIAELEAAKARPESEAQALQSLVEYLRNQRDFNGRWIAVHEHDGHPLAAQRRREVVAEHDAWLKALSAVTVEVR